MDLVYLLDTNILTNPGRPQPDLRVLQKWNEHEAQIATASICWYEAWYGALDLPKGRKRRTIEDYLESISEM